MAEDDFARPLVVWPLLTWSVWMSCFILAYAALEGVTTASSGLSYATRTLRILEQLAKRGTTWPNSCRHAVQHLVAALEKQQKQTVNQVDWSEPPPLQPSPKPSTRVTRSQRRMDSLSAANDLTTARNSGTMPVITTADQRTSHEDQPTVFQATRRNEAVNIR